MSLENCKAGALPTELHPRVDLRFCVAPRFMHGSTALQQHHNSSARLDGACAVGWWGIATVDRERSRLPHGHDATRTAEHRGQANRRASRGSGAKALPRASTRSPGWSRATSRSIRRWKYSVCIAAQCSTDAQRAEVMCVRTHGPEGAPSFSPDAAPAYAHQKPMKQTSPHLAETLRIVVS
jgi:hypothetical protein